jgi:hypothetical protein
MKKLKLGDVQITRELHQDGLTDKLMPCFAKHESGDWGDLPAEDKAIQDIQFAQHPEPDHGTMFISVWFIDGQKVWIVTHYGYATTALYPSQY